MDRKLWSEARAIAARRDPRAAEDLAQDLACAMLENGARAERPAAWMERVGRNAAIDRARVEQRRAELAPQIDPPAAPADPEAALLAREQRGLVRRALALLPRPQRRAALLRFHGELPFQTVAARLGTPEVTARTRVQRALTSLRVRLGSLRAFFLIPGTQAAVLGMTLMVTQFPSAPSPLAIAMADDDAVTAQKERGRRVRLVAVPPAAAATETAKHEDARPDVTSYTAVQRFNFEDENVIADVLSPDELPLVVVRKAEHSSLIEIRQHFVPEMVKSLEDF
ncbi:MAG TPA: sigma-70 family RNA polymerase sigma factor [Polyangia bacterium]|nr:sigma-70 family RNA polymerase sigma factor [Polyangia bacterium]